MHELTSLIKSDMLKALGVTEPGAIAFAVSKAKSYASGELKHIDIILNSGMYKNAFTCGIPNSDNYGIIFATALGYISGDYTYNLEALKNVTENDNLLAKKLVDNNMISATLKSISAPTERPIQFLCMVLIFSGQSRESISSRSSSA